MTVKDVNLPPRVIEEDVTQMQRGKKESDQEYWERVKGTKRARREALEEERAIENMENPPAPPESPFQVKGSIDLGHLDIQEQGRKAQELAETTRKEAQERERELTAKLASSQKDLATSQMSAMMEKMSGQFVGVIKEMNVKIDAVAKGADPSSISGYLDTLEQLAQKMGYQREPAGPAIGDPNLAITLQKMKAEEADRERKWQLELKKFDFEMKRMYAKDEADRGYHTVEMARQAKKDEMFASAPQMLGKAIAQGIMEGEESGAPIMKEASKGGYQVTAVKGEIGEIDCPKCKEIIMIGPTARKAVCASCGLSVGVVRTAAPAEPEGGKTVPAGETEEEERARR